MLPISSRRSTFGISTLLSPRASLSISAVIPVIGPVTWRRTTMITTPQINAKPTSATIPSVQMALTDCACVAAAPLASASSWLATIADSASSMISKASRAGC